jgi:hypothetical protein
MVLLLIDAGFDLPPFVITRDEVQGGILLWVEQGGDQAMHLMGIGGVARLRSRELSQSLGGVRFETILDHAHLHGRQPHWM